MSHTCKNCGNIFDGNFCNNCGQPAHVHDINTKYLWHDVQHGLFHFDKGIVYTLGQLLLRPGHTIRDYIEGKRVGHFAPISLLLVMASFYGLLYHSMDIDTFKYSKSYTSLNYEMVNEWLGHHFALLTLATVPFYALFSYLIFRGQGYNFSQHFVLNSYLASQRLCVSIILLPFLYYTQNNKEQSIVTGIEVIIYILLAYRGFAEFFHNMPKWKVLLLTTLAYIIAVIAMSLCIYGVLSLYKLI